MSLLPTSVDYTDKDFAALNLRLEHLIAAAFPSWTEYQRANFGNILKESSAFTSDVVSFYQDQMARETRWGTAQQRYAMISLARLINYTLDGATAATVVETFSIPASVTGDVTIPAGERIKTANILEPEYFTLLADATITAGNTDTTGTLEHAETLLDPFTVEGVRDEEFVLNNTPFLDDSEEVTIGVDVWTRVDDFLDSGPTDQHYIVLIDQNDKATVRTGDDTNGAIPAPGAAVSVSYKTGGGENGNVEAGSLTKLVSGSTFQDTLGRSVTVSVTNAAAASGGTDRETMAQARFLAPRSLRVLNRAVARTDFEDLALQLNFVARTLMLTSNEDSGIPEGRGYMYVVPVGGGDPTGPQITSIESYINDNFPPPLNFNWEVRTTTVYHAVDIKVWIYLEEDAVAATVATNIREALSAYFAAQTEDNVPNTLIDWGFYWKDENGAAEPMISWSIMNDLIDDVSGIRRLGVPADTEGTLLYGRDSGDPAAPDSGTMDNVTMVNREFPLAGDVKIINGDTAATIYDGSID